MSNLKKLYIIEYQEWNDGAPGGNWYWCGRLWADSQALAEGAAQKEYGSKGKNYRASEVSK